MTLVRRSGATPQTLNRDNYIHSIDALFDQMWNQTFPEFGKSFGVTHAAVLKWESGENRVSPPLEICIRLYILDHLSAKDEEFRALYKELSLEKLSKPYQSAKIHPITVDASADDLKIAL